MVEGHVFKLSGREAWVKLQGQWVRPGPPDYSEPSSWECELDARSKWYVGDELQAAAVLCNACAKKMGYVW